MKNFVYKVQQGNYKMSLLHDKSVPFIFSFNRKYQKQMQKHDSFFKFMLSISIAGCAAILRHWHLTPS